VCSANSFTPSAASSKEVIRDKPIYIFYNPARLNQITCTKAPETMPAYQCEIDPVNKLISIKFSGIVDDVFFLHCFGELVNTPGFDPTYDRIADFRGCLINCKREDLDKIYAANDHQAQIFAENGHKKAYLVDSSLETAVAILFVKKIPNINIKIFSTVAAAAAWLNKTPASIIPQD